jgi:hypothetical protein
MIIIASGFLLSHRQAEFETSTIKQENWVHEVKLEFIYSKRK